MDLKPYTESLNATWDDFVKKSRNGTIMQERRFLNYHYPGRFVDCSLIAYDNRSNITAVLPAALKTEGCSRVFCSHPGSSHGGIVVNNKFGVAEALDLVPLLIENCRIKNIVAIEIKMVPHIYHQWPCDEIDFVLRRNGFFVASTELATALPLKEITPGKHYGGDKVLRNVRKAIKMGVNIHESSDFAAYWCILESNLKQRYNAQPTHTLAEISELINRYPQRIKLFAAFYERQIIGGVVVFLLNNRVVNCFYIAHNYEYQHLRPLDLLFHKLIRWGIEKSYHYLDWGISTENKGQYINTGLFKFKEAFGGRGVLRETYRLNLQGES